MKKKGKPYSILFSIPLYRVDIMVMVGAQNKKDIESMMKNQHVEPTLMKWWLENEHLEELLKMEAGSLVKDGILAIIYHFTSWEDDEHHLNVLVHEVSHMVDSIAKARNLVDETEARAYLTEYLFKTIRKEL